MIITLNENKGSFCQIGDLHFTFVDPGPKDVDLKNLDKPKLNQLLYNLRKGLLKTVDKEEMRSLLTLTEQLPASNQAFSTPNEVPINNNIPLEVHIDHAFVKIAEQEKTIKKLLKQRMDTIKKECADLSSSELRKLVDIEMLGKARSTVIKLAESLIQKKQMDIQQTIGTNPMEVARNQSDLTKGLSAVSLDNLSDVVESEVEQITLNPYPEE